MKLSSQEGEIIEVYFIFCDFFYKIIKVDEDIAVKSTLIKNMIDGIFIC